MKPRFSRFLFALSMGGGLLFGFLLYLFMGTGSESRWIFFGGGLAWGILFFLGIYAIFAVEGIRQRKQRKLLEDLREKLQPYEHHFFGTVKSSRGEEPVLVCFALNRILFGVAYRMKVRVVEFYYCDISYASLFCGLFLFKHQDRRFCISADMDAPEERALRNFLLEYGVCKDVCYETKGKLFFTPEEFGDAPFAGLLFRKRNGEGTPEAAKECLLGVHLMDLERVTEAYAPCLPEGLRDSVGVEYFGKIGLNKEETAAFLARVRELRPLGCEELIPLLERAVAEYDGIELF